MKPGAIENGNGAGAYRLRRLPSVQSVLFAPAADSVECVDQNVEICRRW
jgi:hypothetical protein